MSSAEATFEIGPDEAVAAGPKGLPLIGNLLQIKDDPLNFFVRAIQEYGDVMPYRMGSHRVYMVNSPIDIRRVLATNQGNYGRSKFYDKIEPVLGNATALAEGEKWLALRRTALPAFQGKVMARVSGDIVDAVDDMLAKWRPLADTGEQFDIAPEITRLALEVVLRTLFRIDRKVDTDRIYDALSIVLREVERRVWALTPIGEYLPSKRNRRFRRSIRDLDRMIHEVIADRRRNPEDMGDMLSRLLQATDDPDNTIYDAKQLRDECMNFIIGGRDTAANSITWTLHLLAGHPAVERRVREELDTALQGRAPTYQDIPNLPYLRMVLNESMRLYPPLWTISRVALADDELGGVRIPKGSTLMLCIYAIHRNPKYWDDPDAFDPERFTAERSAGRPQFAYFPFGGGGRACLGRRLAETEAPLIIARLMQAYHLQSVPGYKVEPEPMITLRPKDGIKMTVHAAGRPAAEPAEPAAAERVEPLAAEQSRGHASAGACPFAASVAD